jgi:L-fuconolactonase
MQTNTERPDVSPERHLAVELAWLGKHSEDVIEPDLAIIDAHHHLWGRSRSPHYSFDDYLQDLNSGHKIVATVFVESRAMYRPYGPAELRSVGEVEFANGIAAMSASGDYGRARACAGIVASMDLQAGAKAESIIRAHEAAGGGRLRGFRQIRHIAIIPIYGCRSGPACKSAQ